MRINKFLDSEINYSYPNIVITYKGKVLVEGEDYSVVAVQKNLLLHKKYVGKHCVLNFPSQNKSCIFIVGSNQLVSLKGQPDELFQR